MSTPSIYSPVHDPRVADVVARLQAERAYPTSGVSAKARTDIDPHQFREYGFSIFPEQGDLIYLLCRAIGAKRVVEFATSIGMSTLYFAAAVRDNGGGTVIGSEIVPEKIATAKKNLTDAGLASWADIREGDARETLRNLGGPVDFILIDGWPSGGRESLALQVTKILVPQLRLGGILMNDNAEDDFLAYIRDPAHGFRSMTLPLKGGTEVAVKVG